MESTPLSTKLEKGMWSWDCARCLLLRCFQVIEEIRHSVSAIKTLPPDIQLKARHVYYDGLRYSFATSTLVAAAAVCAALLAKASGLRSTK